MVIIMKKNYKNWINCSNFLIKLKIGKYENKKTKINHLPYFVDTFLYKKNYSLKRIKVKVIQT
jgi:hypothetical protein